MVTVLYPVIRAIFAVHCAVPVAVPDAPMFVLHVTLVTAVLSVAIP